MGSTEIRGQGTAISNVAIVSPGNTGMVDVGNVGDTLLNSEVLLKVGDAGEPKQIWITSIYANATTAGMLYFFHQDAEPAPAAWTDFSAAVGGALHDYSIYIPVNGVALTGVNIGPITEDVCVCGEGTYINTRAGEILITYDYV